MPAKKHMFAPVDPTPNFPNMELDELRFWIKNKVVEKYLKKNENSTKYFSFLDGPITANNPMGVHHGWGRTFKDLWPKYFTMKGYRQRYQNGFDCQGLWVEVEVEKELGLTSKKDIENLIPGDSKASIAKFVNLCRERVYKYSKIQIEQSKRLGYFADWENSYYTLSDDNNYMIWHFLKKCHEKGLIYKGLDSVPWCPRCETAISQHEMLTEDYKELTHETVFVKLPIATIGWENTSLLIWTTTPWTIPANVAVAINKKFTYRVWRNKVSGEKTIIVQKDENGEIPQRNVKKRTLPINEYVFENSDQDANYIKVKDVKGSELLGLRYSAPFDHLQRVMDAQKESPKTFHTVVDGSDIVVSTEGSGLLHIAPGAGQEDFKLGKKEGLPIISVISDDASYLEGLGEYSGKNAKKHPEIIIDFLRDYENGKYLLKSLHYTHRYPACWRCKTELVWKVADEWYIAMDKKDPKDGRTLRQKMVSVAKKINWLPSFGLERELDWLKNMQDWLISKPNRYWGLALPIYECLECGNFQVIGSREELKEKAAVGWDSFDGHTPHKPWIDEVKIKCDKCGSVVSRLPDVGNVWLDAGIVPFSTIKKDNQGEPLYTKDKNLWRKWFPVDFITESFPGQFKNWFYSMIAMSTVLTNENPFKTVLGYATLLAEDGRPMHKSWGNAIEFNEGAEKIGVDVMRWMYVRQNPTDNLLFGYKIADEVRRKFHLKLWNVYNFFITYAILDKWTQKKNGKRSKYILDRWILSRLHNTLEKVEDSLDKFNAYSASQEIEGFVDDLSNWYVRRSRDYVGPAAKDQKDKEAFYLTCYEVLETLLTMLAPFTPFMADNMYKNLTGEESVHLAKWPKLQKNLIDAKLEKQMEEVRDIIELAHAKRKESGIKVRQPLSKLEIVRGKEDLSINPDLNFLFIDELNVKKVEFAKATKRSIKLDTKITSELEEEGKTRDLIRKIQEERKNIGVDLSQKINIVSPWLPENKDLADLIKTKTLASRLTLGVFKVSPN